MTDGRLTFTVVSPQKSFVVPQNPNLLQHTLRGQVSALLQLGLSHPGLQSALKSHVLRHPLSFLKYQVSQIFT